MSDAPKKITKQTNLTASQAARVHAAFLNSPGLQRLRKYFEEGDPSRTKVLHVSPEGP
jgi:hypothetical protein